MGLPISHERDKKCGGCESTFFCAEKLSKDVLKLYCADCGAVVGRYEKQRG